MSEDTFRAPLSKTPTLQLDESLVTNLYPLLLPFFYKANKKEKYQRIARIAIVGNSNAGKSTLLNGILNDANRLKTGESQGTTKSNILVKQNNYHWVDTPGKVKNTPKADVIRVMRYAHLILYVWCINDSIKSVHKVLKENRCLILVINKWDLYSKQERLSVLEKLHNTPALHGIPFLTTSALNKENFKVLRDLIANKHSQWSTFIPKAVINRCFKNTEFKVNQISVKPPTFHVKNLKKNKHSITYMKSYLQKALNLYGIPIKIIQSIK